MPWSQNSQMKPPCRPGGGLERVPVLGEGAVAVAHRVRVLALDERVPLLARAGVGDHRLDRRVHRAGDVAGRLVARPVEHDRALVVQRTGRVVAADPPGGRVVVRAVTALVAERPQDHRRVVLVPPHHPRDPVDEGRQVLGHVGDVVGVRVALDVGLVDDEEPQLVRGVQQGRVVRVVRRPDGVEPEPLHGQQVRTESLGRDRPPEAGVEVVPVDAADHHADAVDEEVVADDLDPPEADPVGRPLDGGAVGIVQGDLEVVQVRQLGRPRRDAGHGRLEPQPAHAERSAGLLDRRPDGRLGRVELDAGGPQVLDAAGLDGGERRSGRRPGSRPAWTEAPGPTRRPRDRPRAGPAPTSPRGRRSPEHRSGRRPAGIRSPSRPRAAARRPVRRGRP